MIETSSYEGDSEGDVIKSVRGPDELWQSRLKPSLQGHENKPYTWRPNMDGMVTGLTLPLNWTHGRHKGRFMAKSPSVQKSPIGRRTSITCKHDVSEAFQVDRDRSRTFPNFETPNTTSIPPKTTEAGPRPPSDGRLRKPESIPKIKRAFQMDESDHTDILPPLPSFSPNLFDVDAYSGEESQVEFASVGVRYGLNNTNGKAKEIDIGPKKPAKPEVEANTCPEEDKRQQRKTTDRDESFSSSKTSIDDDIGGRREKRPDAARTNPYFPQADPYADRRQPPMAYRVPDRSTGLHSNPVGKAPLTPSEEPMIASAGADTAFAALGTSEPRINEVPPRTSIDSQAVIVARQIGSKLKDVFARKKKTVGHRPNSRLGFVEPGSRRDISVTVGVSRREKRTARSFYEMYD